MTTTKTPAKADNKTTAVKSNSQPASTAAKTAATKPVAKAVHIADQIKAFPRRRVWPD